MTLSIDRSHDQFRDFIDLLTPNGPLAVLDVSLAPRSPDILFQLADKAGFRNCGRVLDAGCADGSRTVRLAEEFDCDVVGIDHDEVALDVARARASKTPLASRIRFQQATMEQLPYDDGQFDAIWSREVALHISNLPMALAEGHRVTRPGAPLLIQTYVETEYMEQREATRIYDALTINPRNMREGELLAMLEAASWSVRDRQLMGPEIKEYREETEGQGTRALMRLARLIRCWDKFAAEFGEDVCQRARAFYELTLYQLLGKLSPAFYVAVRR